MQAIPIFEDQFYHDGRGPELVNVNLRKGSAHISTIKFQLPDASYDNPPKKLNI